MRVAPVLGLFVLGLLGVGCGGASDEASPDGPGDVTGGAAGVGGATITAGGHNSGGQGGGAAGATQGSGGGTGTGGRAGSGGGTGTGGRAGSGGGTGTGGRAGSGGSAGTGGAAGASGDGGAPPPHTVGSCDRLGPVGTWEEVTPPAITPWTNASGAFYRPAIFGVDPQHSGTVYLGTDSYNDGNSKGLWKTTDCAASWTHVSTGRNGDAINGGRNWTFAIDPTNSQTMYINSGYYKMGLYKSTNGGVDWDDVTPQGDGAPGFASHVRIDPDNPAHLLLDWHSNCGPFADGIGCFAESTDAGVTWKEHYGTPSWGGQVVAWMLHGSRWIIADRGIQLTTNGGTTWTTAASAAAGGHSAGQLFHAKNGAYYLGTSGGILRSPPGSDGASWSVVPNSGSWALGITGNETTLFLSTSGGFLSSPVNDGLKWTAMPGSPADTTACSTGYDLDHHVLYASCLDHGFWRMRTE